MPDLSARAPLRRDPRPHAAQGGRRPEAAWSPTDLSTPASPMRRRANTSRRAAWCSTCAASPHARATSSRSARVPASRRPSRPSRASCALPDWPLSTRPRSSPTPGRAISTSLTSPGRARPAEEIIAALLPAVVRDFPWPKSMRWGRASAEPGSLHWVRPLQSIVCTFGPETEEPVVVDFEVDGIRSGNVTYGHRFHAPGPIRVRRFDDYAGQAGGGQGRRRRRAPQGDHPRRCQEPCLRQGAAADRGRRPARGGGRAGRMAGRADGRLRSRLSRDPRRGDPTDHPRQPEMLRLHGGRQPGRRGAEPHRPFPAGRQHRGEGWRQRDRPRQRQGGAGAPVRRALFLEDRPGRSARSRSPGRLGRAASTSTSQSRSTSEWPGSTFWASPSTPGSARRASG